MRVIHLCAVLILLAACGDDGASAGNCTTDADCPFGSCMDGYCEAADTGTSDTGAPDSAMVDGASMDATPDGAIADGAPDGAAADADADAAVMSDAGGDAALDGGSDGGSDTGMLASCSGRPHGTTETRECFAAPRAPAGGACSSTTQTRTCDDGTWNPDFPACDWFACGPGSALWIDRLGSTMTNEVTNDGAVDAVGNAYVIASNISGFHGVQLEAYASDGTPRWTRTAGGTSRDDLADVAVDGTGNVFVAGYATSDAIDLGGGDLSFAAGDSGSSPILASYTGDDVHRWSIRVPGNGQATAIATNTAGKVYLGGQAFGEIALEGTRVTVPATGGGFVARYGNGGLVEWSRIVGTSVSGVGGDGSGNVFVAGTFGATEDFGGMTRTGPGNFVASYRSDGTLRWVQEILGSVSVTSLAVSPTTGQVVIAGSFTGMVDFGDGPVTASTGGSDRDPYAVVYDNDGAVDFVKNINAGGTSRATDVAFDADGNVYVVGYMQGGFDFETETTYSLSGRVRIFWVSYDATGAHRWSRIVGGTLTEEFAYGVGVGDYAIITGRIDSVFGVDGQVTGGWVEDGLVLALVR